MIQKKTQKCYFWLESNLIQMIDQKCAEKLISRSAYIRWVLLNFDDNVIQKINDLHNELVIKKKLKKMLEDEQ